MRGDVLFDTLSFMDTLKKSGMSQEQAEATTKAVSQAFHQMIDCQEIFQKRTVDKLKENIKSHINLMTFLSIGLSALCFIVILFMIGVY